MNIKLGKFEANVPTALALFGLLVVDNVYANHCKKKAVAQMLKTEGKSDK